MHDARSPLGTDPDQPSRSTLPGPLGQLAAGPVFVVGRARSGTTWVHDMYVAHPEVAGVFESWLFTADQGLLSLLNDATWQKPHTGLAQLMDRPEMIAELRELSANWLARVLEPHHRFLVEKSPRHYRWMEQIVEIYPEARFVHVMRDGRDVAVSVEAAAKSWAPHWQQSFGRSRFMTARSWGTTIDEIRRRAADLGDRYLEVRFEDLKADHRGGIRHLLDFGGMPTDDGVVDDIARRTDFERQHGDESGEDKFRRGGRVGDWEARFGMTSSLLFEIGAGAQLRRAGYETGRMWWRHQPLLTLTDGHRRSQDDRA